MIIAKSLKVSLDVDLALLPCAKTSGLPRLHASEDTGRHTGLLARRALRHGVQRKHWVCILQSMALWNSAFVPYSVQRRFAAGFR